MTDGWIRRALKKLSDGENIPIPVPASGSPRILIADIDDSESLKLRSRHRFDDEKEWWCIDCKQPFRVRNSKDLDEVECPKCHGILPLGLMRKLALYELDKKRENT